MYAEKRGIVAVSDSFEGLSGGEDFEGSFEGSGGRAVGVQEACYEYDFSVCI